MIGVMHGDRLYCRFVADAEMQDLHELYECSTVLNYNTNCLQILLCCEICVIKLQFIR